MTHVVTENCILCKYGTCVEVCPVVCFHEGKDFLVINPNECVDCAMCVEACEADAIYRDIDLPDDYLIFKEINEELSRIWPMITEVSTCGENPDYWNEKKDKAKRLEQYLFDRHSQ